MALAVTLAAGGVLFLQPRAAEAHCDNINGPVATAAKQALEAGNVKLVLPYVKAADEQELAAAFEHTVAVRKISPEAKTLADQYFLETAVRLHRKGEGAAYTGLKYEDDYGPALNAAEAALKSGDISDVQAVVADAYAKLLAEKWAAVLEAREKAAKEGTVEADRERAEAELLFEIYVHTVYQAVTGELQQAEGGGGAAGGHTHGSGAAPAAGAAEHAARLVLNGKAQAAPALIHGDLVLLPLRPVMEAAGGQIAWDEPSGSIQVTLGKATLHLAVGQTEVELNGEHLTLPAAPVLHDDLTYVPAHLLQEFAGITASVSGETVTVSLH
jgi:hypothetical protein